jgi:Domain of unknown function (DUF4279)
MKPIDIVLLIRHPQMDPVNITRVLELEPTTSWKFGDQVKTPKGNLVPDIRKHTSWSHVFRITGNRPFFEEVEHILLGLKTHKEFFAKILGEGGFAEIYLQLPGQVNQGSSAKPSLLQSIADLGLHLGIEVFPEM